MSKPSALALFARHILHSATIESIKLKQTSTMHKFHRHIDTQRSRKWFSFFGFNEVQVVNIYIFLHRKVIRTQNGCRLKVVCGQTVQSKQQQQQ